MPAADAAEALRLAGDLARTLDQLLSRRSRRRGSASSSPICPSCRPIGRRRSISSRVILADWPRTAARRGRIDLAERRNRLLERASRGAGGSGRRAASSSPPASPPRRRRWRGCCGIVARLERGDGGAARARSRDARRGMGRARAARPDPVTGRRRPPIETHPQFQLKLLLDRMGVGRGEVERWRWGGGRDAPAARSRAIAHAMAPASLHRGMAGSAARRTAADRRARARARRSGRGGAGDRARAARGAGDARRGPRRW